MKKNIYHTVMISDIDTKMIGEEVVVSGWISNIRDHGGVLFLDLRDTTGVLQTVSNDDELFKVSVTDGEKDIIALGVIVKEHFGEKAEPLYERLAKYFQILDSYSFLEWK